MAIGALRSLSRALDSRMLAPGRCPNCGYDRSGKAPDDRCSECGLPYESARSFAMLDRRSIAWAPSLLGPMSCLLMLAVDETIKGPAVLAAIIILCREILVSGLREYLAELRVTVQVTWLAKWKTFLQLLAVGFLIAGEAGDRILPITTLIGVGLLWFSALLTLYTGWDYFRAGVQHLIED